MTNHKIARETITKFLVVSTGTLLSIFWEGKAESLTIRQGITNNSGQTANDLRLCFNTSVNDVSIFVGKQRNGVETTNTKCGRARSNFATFAEDPENSWDVSNGTRIGDLVSVFRT